MVRKKTSADKSREREYLSRLLDDTACELMRQDFNSLDVSSQKRQFRNLLALIQSLQTNLESATTIREIHETVVDTLYGSLAIDAAVLLEGDRRHRRFKVLAGRGIDKNLKYFSPDKRRKTDESFSPSWVNGTVKPSLFQRRIITTFSYPYFIWCPIPENDNRALVFYLGNSYEDLLTKQPFDEDYIECMRIAGSAVSPRRKRIRDVEELIRQKEYYINFLVEIIQTAPIAILASSDKRRIIYANKAAELQYGYPANGLLGADPGSFCAESLHGEIVQDMLQTLSRGDTWRGELLSRRKNGETFTCRITLYRVLDNAGNFLAEVGIMEDVTEQKKIAHERRLFEEKLSHFQKMESIGRLTGAIAHDFNNLLTTIIGYGELLSAKIGEGDTHERKMIAAILRSAENAAELTDQLLGFARKGKYNPEPLQMNRIVREVVNIWAALFDERITMNFRLGRNMKWIKADKSQIERALANIIINARDAMPNGGVLTFATGNVRIGPGNREKFLPLSEGEYVELAISDTGSGIPREIQDRIFEPFFTTKPRGKGTGLGLATAYSIIEHHKGRIFFESSPGEGTTFFIYLPAIARKKW